MEHAPVSRHATTNDPPWRTPSASLRSAPSPEGKETGTRASFLPFRGRWPVAERRDGGGLSYKGNQPTTSRNVASLFSGDYDSYARVTPSASLRSAPSPEGKEQTTAGRAVAHSA